jgi:multidrug transporter EmrE-like cation transporter
MNRKLITSYSFLNSELYTRSTKVWTAMGTNSGAGIVLFGESCNAMKLGSLTMLLFWV